MLVPTHCQTCGEPMGHLWPVYLEYVQKFAREQKKPIGQQNVEHQKSTGEQRTPEYLARQELIDKHGMDGRRQCCLYALFVNYDITDIIN